MHRHIKKLTILIVIAGVLLYLFSPQIIGQSQQTQLQTAQIQSTQTETAVSQGKVYSLTINGAISPASADYFIRGLDQAIENNADILILSLNTPGGLDKSMRLMIQAILDSPLPVVTYIAPKGARGASAGTYIIYASHIAAMAPATNLGSATPVSLGITKPQQPDTNNDNQDSDNKNSASDDDIMHQKVINDAQAYIRSLAQLRGRNEEWAVQAVSQAANLSVNEALDKKVIDLIAYNQKILIEKLHLYKVKLANKTITLQLINPEIIEVVPDWRTEVLLVITDPGFAYLLLLAGIYGLMFEFINPGSLLPGTIGVICLIVALYALNLLPINMAGLALLLVGLVLMIVEAFMPSFGILGIGGIAAFTLGSFMLMDSSLPGYQIAPALIISTALASAIAIIFMLSMVIKAKRKPLVSGDQQLINHQALAVEDFNANGRVMIRGEVWQACCDQPVKKDQKLIVKNINGLTLTVATLNNNTTEE